MSKLLVVVVLAVAWFFVGFQAGAWDQGSLKNVSTPASMMPGPTLVFSRTVILSPGGFFPSRPSGSENRLASGVF